MKCPDDGSPQMEQLDVQRKKLLEEMEKFEADEGGQQGYCSGSRHGEGEIGFGKDY